MNLLVAGMAVAAFAGCSGDDQGPGELPLVIEKPVTKSGDEQTGPVGVALGNPLRVLITREGEPVEGVGVDWAAGQGGSVSDEQESDADGFATVVWTLGPDQGTHSATAEVDGAEGSPLTYTATATTGTGPPPGPTVQVLGPEGGNRFEPNLVTINVGQSVTWSWPEGALDHNVVPDDGNTPIPSGPVTDGPTTYSFTFTQAGSFRYFCRTHGGVGGFDMAGRVIVNQAQP
jgi:plastocyanin